MPTLASYLVHSRHKIYDSIEAYIFYYELLLPYIDRVLLITFEQATTQFGQVVDTINRRFKMTLRPVAPTAEFLDAVYGRVRNEFWGASPLTVSVPSQERRALLEQARQLLERPQYKARLNDAQDLYAEFLRKSAARQIMA